MSINTMTKFAVDRKLVAAPAALETGEEPISAPSGDRVNAALELITAYIPTEVLTLYVAVAATLQQAAGQSSFQSSWIAFWFFLVFTPIAVWLIYAPKFKAKRNQLPLHPRDWPKWEMIAGAVAYLAWAFALPNTPFKELAFYNSALSGVVVLVTSSLLGLISPIVPKPKLDDSSGGKG